ncbi:MAG: hypothetical protein JSS04_17020, partial [Proteobacteria bacterium]|nr:hypothetical protein [Pseudomonadota bacterium]
MTRYIVNRRTFLFPSTTPQPGGQFPLLERGQRLTGQPANAFVHKTDDPAGFVDARNVAEIPESVSIGGDLGRGTFCRAATAAAGGTGADRNYLLSAAYFLSGNLANLGTAESVAVGPFAYTIDDWLAGIDAANAAGHALLAVDLFDPARQLTVAALRAVAAGRAFATAAGRPARPVELFLFERLG